MKNLLIKHNKEVEEELNKLWFEDWQFNSEKNYPPNKDEIEIFLKGQNFKLYNKIIEGVEKEGRKLEKQLDKRLYADVQARIEAQLENVNKNIYNQALKDFLNQIKG